MVEPTGCRRSPCRLSALKDNAKRTEKPALVDLLDLDLDLAGWSVRLNGLADLMP